MDLPTFSASKIKTFRTCQRQYYYKYILPRALRPTEDKNIGALLGIALHKAIEQKYRFDASPTQTFQQVMLETLDEWEEKNYVVRGVEWFSKSMKDGKAILNSFDWSRFEPIDVELEFLLPFPNKKHPIALITGYIDMITVNGEVIDHKSQRKMPNQDQLNHESQFILYAWAFQQLYGTLPNMVIWNHLRTNTPIIADVLTEFDFKLDQLTQDLLAMISPSGYPRRQMDSICTSECGFYTQCYGLRVKDQIVIEDVEE